MNSNGNQSNDRIVTLEIIDVSVGNYVIDGTRRKGGVSLQLIDINNGDHYYSVCNVITKRKDGKPLPVGSFRITKNYALFKLWIMFRLPLPKKVVKNKVYINYSKFGDSIGKLKGFIVKGTIHSKIPDRIEFTSLTLVTPNEHSTNTQSAPNVHPISSPNDLNENTEITTIHRNQTTCVNKHDKRNELIRGNGNSDHLSSINKGNYIDKWDINNILKPIK